MPIGMLDRVGYVYQGSRTRIPAGEKTIELTAQNVEYND